MRVALLSLNCCGSVCTLVLSLLVGTLVSLLVSWDCGAFSFSVGVLGGVGGGFNSGFDWLINRGVWLSVWWCGLCGGDRLSLSLSSSGG